MASRWLVTGAAGMLGSEVVAALASRGDIEVIGADRAALDVGDRDAVAKAVAGVDVVINTAAWTNVDAAEAAEAEAGLVNGEGVRNLAAECAESGSILLHVSTDFVFSGDAHSPIPESAPTAPINAYGRSKLIGERAVASLLPNSGYVVRTAWLYGENGPSFVAKLLELARQRETLDVVDDQRGQPTWSRALASGLIELAQAARTGRAPAGVYHATASGEATRSEFACAVFEEAGLSVERLRPTTSDKFPSVVKRPAYSVLGNSRWVAAGLEPLADWREMLHEAMRDITGSH